MKNKKEIIVNNIDDYIALQPQQIRPTLEQLRQTIQKAAPAAVEAISYQIPTFKLNGNLVHFAAFKNHIGFYPGAAGIEAFTKELNGFTTSKGTVQFPLEQKIPFALITKIVKFRVEQNTQKIKK